MKGGGDMEQKKKKSPETETGALKIKALDILSSFLMILATVFLVLHDHEEWQDFTIMSLIIANISSSLKMRE